MWYPPTVTAEPESEPVTVEDAKTWARLESSDDDDRIEGALLAARAWVEDFTGTRLVEQTVALKCDGFCDFDNVPLAPIQSVAISYVDTTGASQTLAGTVYELRADGLQASIVLKYGQTWPGIRSGSRVTVTAVVGYEEPPPSPLQAIRLLAAAIFDGAGRPEAEAAAQTLLANHRRFLS